MDRIVLTLNGAILYDNGATTPDPVPAPIPTPTPLPPPPPMPAGDPGVLEIDGQPYDFGVGMTTFRMPVEAGKHYLIQTAETYKPVTVFVKREDGNDVLPPVIDNGGHAYVYFLAPSTGTYTVVVNALEQGGHIERHAS